MAPEPRVPESAFFVGFGGGYQAVGFNNQNSYAQGVSRVFQSGAPAAVGAASGSTHLDLSDESRIAPLAQFGYFQHVAGSNWLWGAKFSYDYAGATATKQPVLVPQAGSFTGVESSAFTGNVFIRSYEVSLDHLMTFTPFIGRSFDNWFPYVGGGLSVAQTRTKLDTTIGFADINGIHTSITGAPSTFTNTDWVAGGTVMVGACYFISRSWFVDLSYGFSFMENPTNNYAAPFANNNGRFISAGILSGNSSGGVFSHSLFLSINRAF